MWDEQTTFAANFPGFVLILEDEGTAYRLAANVVLGTSSAGYEQAKLGDWLSLDPAHGANPGFLRDAAEQHIRFVSASQSVLVTSE